jgi:hypothetical protein
MGLCGRDKGHTKWLVVQLGQHGNEGKGRLRDTSCRKLARCLCVYLSFLLESRHCIVGLCFFGGVAQTPHQSSSSASFENVTQNPVHCVVLRAYAPYYCGKATWSLAYYENTPTAHRQHASFLHNASFPFSHCYAFLIERPAIWPKQRLPSLEVRN